MATKNGTGQGGKSFQDRELAARVRTLTLAECEKHLKKGKGKLYEQVLLKLASSVLPRLNEHSGPDGENLVITFDSAFNPTSNG
jgi:hypothetical protein